MGLEEKGGETLHLVVRQAEVTHAGSWQDVAGMSEPPPEPRGRHLASEAVEPGRLHLTSIEARYLVTGNAVELGDSRPSPGEDLRASWTALEVARPTAGLHQLPRCHGLQANPLTRMSRSAATRGLPDAAMTHRATEAIDTVSREPTRGVGPKRARFLVS